MNLDDFTADLERRQLWADQRLGHTLHTTGPQMFVMLRVQERDALVREVRAVQAERDRYKDALQSTLIDLVLIEKAIGPSRVVQSLLEHIGTALAGVPAPEEPSVPPAEKKQP